MQRGIEVFGTDTCKDTIATRRHLDALDVDYEYVDIDEDPDAAARVEEWNDGERKTPTVVLAANGDSEPRVLSVPGDTELDAALDESGLLPDTGRGDGSPGLDG